MRVGAITGALAACAIACGPAEAPRDTPVAPYEQPVTIAAPQPPLSSASVAPSASAAPEPR